MGPHARMGLADNWTHPHQRWCSERDRMGRETPMGRIRNAADRGHTPGGEGTRLNPGANSGMRQLGTNDRPPIPTPGALDRVKVATEAGASLVPVVGGTLAVTLGALIPSTLERRRHGWEAWVDQSLSELVQNGLDLDALAEDERFVTAVIQTTRIALGTHLEAKLRLLAGCLTSVALDPPSDFLTSRFLRWVDDLSVEHFNELASRDHRDGGDRQLEQIQAMLDDGFDHTVRLLAEQDLVREGLFTDDEPGRPERYSPKLRISPLGTQLLDFVRYMTEHDEFDS